MEFKVEKNEQFALIELKETSLTQENSPELEEIVRKLFREGYGNIILEFNLIEELDGFGISLIRKANKICLNELGLLIVVTKNDDIINQLDDAKIEDLTVMPTTQEAIDAVYLNELEYINGFIYANVWTTNKIVKIDPATGKIVGKLDLISLLHEARTKYAGATELNGIAFDAANNKIYVTGKLWPNIYRIEFPH